MKTEKKCWICRRTEKEAFDDAKGYVEDCGIPEGAFLQKFDVLGHKTWVCMICSALVYSMTHHDEGHRNPDEIVLFQDLKIEIIKVLKSLLIK